MDRTWKAWPNRDWLMNLGKTWLWRYETLVGRYSLVGNRPFFEAEQFPWVAEFERHWQIIRQELDRLLEYGDRLPNFQDISPDQVAITNDNRWKTYFLYAYGVKVPENCQRCPETTRLLALIPGMKTAMFSILSGGKHIPEHRGPYKGVLRYHLALKVPGPAGACRIRVRDEIRPWQEGKSLIFDDSYVHEAWNDSDETRVVLFVDVVRPLAWPWSWLNQGLIFAISRSPFIQDAIANNRRWQQTFTASAGPGAQS
ncbi:MAG: aspartyl/asparaginyl beta-hydroxylase domain-containing protein [Chloroflexaceae bacterium]|nr:aspartyl/asparaginyl beta-hydroxylase domain-containing protein [Chloroflexaceae bacterium]